MVSFNVDHDTDKPDDVCKDIVDNIPSTVLEMVNGTVDNDIEHAVGIAETKDEYFTTEIKTGDESNMGGQIMQDLWLQVGGAAPSFNTNVDKSYLAHTHPSGLAGMSLEDVISAITFLDKASPVSGNFIISLDKGKVKINGLVVKETVFRGTETMKRKEVQEAVSSARAVRGMVEEGQMTPTQGRTQLMKDASKVFNSCSYATSLADIENRTMGQRE
jgi:hypothetical protein